MAKPKNEIFENAVKINEAVDGHLAVGDSIQAGRVDHISDRGPDYFEYRIYIKDHGREEVGEVGRDPEWIDFSEINGTSRLKKLTDIINIGSETNNPFVFKGSTITINLENADFIFDNLKRATLVTIDGNDAKFMQTVEGDNLDLISRPAKIIGLYDYNGTTVQTDIAHYTIKNIETSTKGTAKIMLDSPERAFMEESAEKVKDGRNWYFDRSVKFLAEELIKTVRRKYSDSTESMLDEDRVSVDQIETNDGSRIFSEFGRPIVNVKFKTESERSGDKRYIVTCAAPITIFRFELDANYSVGSNFIKLTLANAQAIPYIISKGDVLTIGKTSGTSFSDLNAEKVTVTEEASFTTASSSANVRITSLKKSHVSGEYVDRNCILFGGTRTLENTQPDESDNIVGIYDPDRDEAYSLLNSGNSQNFQVVKYPIRYMQINQTTTINQTPSSSPLYFASCNYSTYGKPNEPGIIGSLSIDNDKQWNAVSENGDVSDFIREVTDLHEFTESDGGVYTGEFCFRSLKSLADSTYIAASGNPSYPAPIYGAQGVGQFVQEDIEYKITGAERYLGFGFMCNLATDILATDESIEILSPAFNKVAMAIRYGGTVHVIGGPKPDECEDLVITSYDLIPDNSYQENFFDTITIGSAEIESSTFDWLAIANGNRVTINLQSAIGLAARKENAVILVLPDSGKMYMRNVGENIFVNEPQKLTFGSYNARATEAVPLDTDKFSNLVRLEKKEEIDQKKSVTARTIDVKNQEDTDKGYYGIIAGKKKFEVEYGDVIDVNDSGSLQLSKIRVIPSEYICTPYKQNDYDFGIPMYEPELTEEIGSFGLYYKSTGGAFPDITGAPGAITNDIGYMMMPIIGVWAKYNKNSSLTSFDGSPLSENGNAELLGYFYVDTHGAGDITKKGTFLAIADANGEVFVDTYTEGFDDLFESSDHMPLCTVINTVDSDEFTTLFGGEIITDNFIVGSRATGLTADVATKKDFTRWEPKGTDFSVLLPKTYRTGLTAAYKYKKLRDPRAKGAVFISPFCTSVRQQHFHLPVESDNTESFRFSRDIDQGESASSIVHSAEFNGDENLALTISDDYISEYSTVEIDHVIEIYRSDDRFLGSFQVYNLTPAAAGFHIITVSTNEVSNTVKDMFDQYSLVAADAYSWEKSSPYRVDCMGVDTKFDIGSEESINNKVASGSNWVADRFSQLTTRGLVVGDDTDGAGGETINMTLQRANSDTALDLNIPFGGYRGKSNIVPLTLGSDAVPTCPIKDTYFLCFVGVIVIRYEFANHTFSIGEKIKITHKGIDIGKWVVLTAVNYDATQKVITIKSNDFTTVGTPTPGDNLQLMNPMRPGDRYQVTGNTSGYFVVMSTYLEETLAYFKWVPVSTYVAIPASGTLTKISARLTNALETITYTGFVDTNIEKTNYAEMPMYVPEYIWHKDFLPYVPYEDRYSHDSLGYFKIGFNTGPTIDGNVNYPKALYSRNLPKFWYYPQRSGEDEYIKGGNFDSGIKPMDFGTSFYNTLAKWYLTIEEVGSSALCSAYSINYNNAALGQEDNVHAIVHPNETYYGDTSAQDYAYLRHCMGHNNNFLSYWKNDTYKNFITLYFTAGTFAIDSNVELTIGSIVKKLWTSTGISTVISLPTGLGTPQTIDAEVHGLWTNKYDDTQLQDEDLRIGLVLWEPFKYISGYVRIEDENFTGGTLNKFFGNIVENVLVYKNGTWLTRSWTIANNPNYDFIIGPDDFSKYGRMFLVKDWQSRSETYSSLSGFNIRGVILRRYEAFNSSNTLRTAREMVAVINVYGLAASSILDGQYTTDHNLTSMDKFTFRVDANTEDGYFFVDTSQNQLIKWNGIDRTGADVNNTLGNSNPTVEGDFGQYCKMIHLETAYEEIYGFSHGTRLQPASSAIKGGRAIVWKLSAAVSFHIAVADFSNLTIWNVLSQFAELTNSIMSFNRSGKLIFQTRPNLTIDTPYAKVFDKIALGNVLSMQKKQPLNSSYNYIEVVPSKPIVPDPKIDLQTASDINAVTLNHETFIADRRITVNQSDRNKKRPNIKAYQKDYERKRILLICNNGQFAKTAEEEERGLYSRWQYKMIRDKIEIRLAEAITDTTQNYIIVNRIPYDDVSSTPAINRGDVIFLGNTGPFIVNTDTDEEYILPFENKIILDNTIISVTVEEEKFDYGIPVIISETEDLSEVFYAKGEGDYYSPSGGLLTKSLTYSPKSFFTEIGEWVFDESFMRERVFLVSNADLVNRKLFLNSVEQFNVAGGIVTIKGELMEYSSIDGNALVIRKGLNTEYPVRTEVIPMPINPTLGQSGVNSDYNPGNWRIGGYDEIGPTCLNGYHMYDPNEDGNPYYSADPNSGGQPITALEFYWSGQKEIAYTEDNGLRVKNSETGFDYRIRHRTFVEMLIDFQESKFVSGDKIDLDIPGLNLQRQIHLKKIYANHASIQINGLRQFPTQNNRFFNNTTSYLMAQKIVDYFSNIKYEVILQVYMDDITELDYFSIIKIIDKDLFPGIENNTRIGYVRNIKNNPRTKIATISALVV